MLLEPCRLVPYSNTRPVPRLRELTGVLKFSIRLGDVVGRQRNLSNLVKLASSRPQERCITNFAMCKGEAMRSHRRRMEVVLLVAGALLVAPALHASDY